MPTLEQREKETPEELKQRLEARTLEMGITYTFSQYLEQMETYLLQLERRVMELESEKKAAPGDTD